MSIWTQRARITWRPLVSFFEQKTEILRDLEKSKLLRRFSVSENRIAVDVIDPHHFLAFGPESIEIVALKPDADMDSLAAAADCVWTALDPGSTRRLSVWLQSLVPCVGSYDKVRASAGDRVITWSKGIRNVDFAIIGDLAADDLGAEGRYEAGVVERQEAAGRLSRKESAIEPSREISPSLFPSSSLPEVALYSAQEWRLAEPKAKTRSDIFDLWSRVTEHADQVDASLFGYLIEESNEHGDAS